MTTDPTPTDLDAEETDDPEVPADLLVLAIDLDVAGETPEALTEWAEAIA